MTKELQNLLSLLESPNKENRDLGAIVAKNYKDEFKTHFGYEIAEYQELITFLITYCDWDSQTPIMEITEVRLYHRQAVEIPQSIILLSNLQELELNGNLSVTLPDNIGALRKLRILGLSSNQLTFLPANTEKFVDLMYLDLSNNQLTSLPENIWRLRSLRHLNLLGNHFTILPEIILELKELGTLDITDNHLISLPKKLKNRTDYNIYVGENPTQELRECVKSWKNIIYDMNPDNYLPF